MPGGVGKEGGGCEKEAGMILELVTGGNPEVATGTIGCGGGLHEFFMAFKRATKERKTRRCCRFQSMRRFSFQHTTPPY